MKIAAPPDAMSNERIAYLRRKLDRKVHRFFCESAKRGLPLRRNEQRLAALRDKHSGKRAVVIGMGPSLKVADLNRFKGFVTFACNKIYLSFPEVDWRPDYYTIVDVLVAQNNRQEARGIRDVTKIHPIQVRSILGSEKDAIYYGTNGRICAECERPFFRSDPRDGLLSHGFTVLIDQIQIAYCMGIRELYLVGVDFSFEVSKSTGVRCASGEVLVSEGEVNHFHPSYRKLGETWTVPRMEEQRLAFAYARRAFEADGGRIINASRISKLDALERIDFEMAFPI